MPPEKPSILSSGRALRLDATPAVGSQRANTGGALEDRIMAATIRVSAIWRSAPGADFDRIGVKVGRSNAGSGQRRSPQGPADPTMQKSASNPRFPLTELTALSILTDMGVKERREREKTALREEILDAARDLFIKEGYESLSMRRIAEKIEYSPTTIYLYFRDKDDLIRQVCQETFSMLIQILQSLHLDHENPLVGLRKAGYAYVQFGLEHPDHYRAAFVMPHCHDPKRLTQEEIDSSAGMQCFNS